MVSVNNREPRSKANHLTEDEKKILRECYDKGYSPQYANQFVKCTERTVHMYYVKFRGYTNPRNIKNSEKLPVIIPEHVSIHEHIDYYPWEPKRTAVSLPKVSFLDS